MTVGRSRETILRGGFQIHPHAVESRFQARPVVDDVCAIGLPLDEPGELVSVSIVPEGAAIGEEVDDLPRLRWPTTRFPIPRAAGRPSPCGEAARSRAGSSSAEPRPRPQ